jgi:hypothetical protein
MRRQFAVCLLVVALVLASTGLVYAWGSGTHVYIADRVFPECGDKTNLHYGSVAPDLYDRAAPEKWPTAFHDTHYTYIDLRSEAWSPASEAFADGWLTHNEEWGADHSAHIENPCEPGEPGYVIGKAADLVSMFPHLDPGLAHLVIEAGVDLLVKENQDPALGDKLVQAGRYRSRHDLCLLTRVLVLEEGRTDLLTLALADLAHRAFLIGYGTALALPRPLDRLAVAALFVALAREFYDTQIPLREMFLILRSSIDLCKDDYPNTITQAIEDIKAGT